MTLTNQYTWEEIVERTCDKLDVSAGSFKRKPFKEWMLTKEKFGYLFDPFMYYRCYLISKKLVDDFDYIMAVCGGEGLGKTTFAIQMASVISSKPFTSESVCSDAKEFINALAKAEEGSVIVADEGAYFLFSRDSMGKDSKIIIKLLTIIRQKRLCVIINVVNYFLLDTYLRDHRVELLVQIHKRGKYRQIVKKGINVITTWAKKTKNVFSIKLKSEWFRDGTWNKDYPVTFDVDNYLRKKREHMEEAIRDAIGVVTKQGNNGQQLIAVHKVAKSMGLKTNESRKFIQDRGLKATKIGLMWYIKVEDADKLLTVKELPPSERTILV